MSDEEAGSVPFEKEDPTDASDDIERSLIDEEDQDLEQDESEEATAEAGMSEGGVELPPTPDVKFEEDESGVAR
jgi:hypothetical protein